MRQSSPTRGDDEEPVCQSVFALVRICTNVANIVSRGQNCEIMPIPIGTQLGSTEVTTLLGKGVMGGVYRSRDTKLKREVAIKILPEEFSRDIGCEA